MPPRFAGELSVIPQAVLATNTNRVAVESVARASSVADREGVLSTGGDSQVAPIRLTGLSPARVQAFTTAEPIPLETRKAVLEALDKDLVAVGLLDKVGGDLSPKVASDLSFELETCLPTSAILIKGCLDECDVCEPERKQEIKLELERKDLENKLLERQIELLEKSQEYRCCPAGEAEETGDED